MTPSNVTPSGMTDYAGAVTELARDLVRIDSRSPLSNRPVAERIEAELADFEVERLDYRDRNGVEKRALVAHRGGKGGLALSGHLDTVPETGWRSDPWSGRIEEGRLQGLGSTDMKGPMAAAIVAARALPTQVPITLLLTTDEEITKAGAREIAQRSVLVREAAPEGIVVVEPTRMVPMRGHRVHIVFTAVASGIQAHSSTGRGRNANWDLLPFLMDMRALHERLRNDADLQDPDYDPPFSDFNLVLDNHGSAVNVTVPKATATIKFRYSAKVDPQPVADIVRDAARRGGLALSEAREGGPPELPELIPWCGCAARFRASHRGWPRLVPTPPSFRPWRPASSWDPATSQWRMLPRRARRSRSSRPLFPFSCASRSAWGGRTGH